MSSASVKSIARCYATVNKKNPQEYWDYESYKLPYSENDQNTYHSAYNAAASADRPKYEVLMKVGKGKYSDVFKGIDIKSKKYVVIKMLKPVRRKRIQRELKILSNLNAFTEQDCLFNEESYLDGSQEQNEER